MVSNPLNEANRRIQKWVDNKVSTALNKFGEVPVSRGGGGFGPTDLDAPYYRDFPAPLIYHIRRRSALVNNAIEEKVSQTTRRGWSEWEKKYEAKCPNCHEEFGSEQPFRDLVDDTIPEDTDLDFSKPRECPNCGEMEDMITPDPEDLQRAKDFFAKANSRKEWQANLEPEKHSSVSQSYMEVLKQVATDIQSFDDGWMIFDRTYKLRKSDGEVLGYDLEQVYRAPPELMDYSHDETGTPGGEYWICLQCRANDPEHYQPSTAPGDCEECGAKLHEVYAYAKKEAADDNPAAYFIRGEFAHASEYEQGVFHGYSPIITLMEEARTLMQMDSWYNDSYEFRRAPRAALAIKGGNAKGIREWNKGQFDKMQQDPQHIPTLMDDSDGNGDPIALINLLESPAEMQHMEMREWFKDRISAKYGVTDIMMSGSSENGGLSQSMEIQVSNRSADRLRRILNEKFVAPTLAQLGVDQWSVEVAEVEEEDEQVEADLQQKHLNLAQMAAELGLSVEWTPDNRAEIKAGDVQPQEDEGGSDPFSGADPFSDGPGGGDGTGPMPGDGASADTHPMDGGGDGFADQTPQGNTRSGLQPGRPSDVTNRGGGE